MMTRRRKHRNTSCRKKKPENQAKKKPLKKKATIAIKQPAGPAKSEAEKVEDLNRLVEEGDYALTEELFGVEASGSATAPVNKEEHEAMGVIVGKKIAGQVESYHFPTLMKSLFKEALTEASSSQIKELVSALNVMASEKQKLEKAKDGKKSKKKGGKTLAKDFDAFDGAGFSTQDQGDYVGFDDGDFM